MRNFNAKIPENLQQKNVGIMEAGLPTIKVAALLVIWQFYQQLVFKKL